MNWKCMGLGLLALALPIVAEAHGPTRQKAVQQIEINAAPAAVWQVVGDFNGMPRWHPAVAQSTATAGNAVGSQRVLTLKNGATITETLEAYDATQMSLKYRMREGALPVTNYQSTIAVRPQGGGSVVEWKGAFYRGYPNNDPPPELSDEAAVKAINEIYQTGLESLKRVVEAGR